MKPDREAKWIAFYFGSCEGEDRLAMERELLSDPESLVDFLDLKRRLEAAEALPQGPSLKVWKQLQSRWKAHPQKAVPLAFGILLAACAMVLFMFYIHKDIQAPVQPHFLFDSFSELSAASNVL